MQSNKLDTNTAISLLLQEDWLSVFELDHELIELKQHHAILRVALLKDRKFFFNIGISPLLTPYNAIIVHNDSKINSSTQFNLEQSMYKSIIPLIRKYDRVQLKFPIHQLSMPRIYDNRLESIVSYTEIIESPVTFKAVWDSINSDNKNHIYASQKTGEILEIKDAELAVHNILKNPYYNDPIINKRRFINFIDKLIHSQDIKIYSYKLNNEIVSTSVFLKLGQTVYYWLNSINKQNKVRGMHFGLILEGIKWCELCNCSFNFDGSSNEEIAKVIKTFGTKTIIYPNNYIYYNTLLKFISKFK